MTFATSFNQILNCSGTPQKVVLGVLIFLTRPPRMGFVLLVGVPCFGTLFGVFVPLGFCLDRET